MAGTKRDITNLVKKIKDTDGWKVEELADGYKAISEATGRSTKLPLRGGNGPASMLNLITQLRRIGWTEDLHERQVAIRRNHRLEAAKREEEALAALIEARDAAGGPVLAEDEVASPGVEEVRGRWGLFPAPLERPADLDNMLRCPNGMTVRLEAITPEQARAYLALNSDDFDEEGRRKQRRKSEKKVQDTIARIHRGEWKLIHQGIAFDTEGRCIDGQHRLEAIAESGISCPVLVTRMMPPDSFDVIDDVKPRSGADFLHIQGERNETLLASALRVMFLWENIPQNQWPKYPAMSKPQLAEVMGRHPRLRESVAAGDRFRRTLSASPTALAVSHYLISLVNPHMEDEVEDFFDRLATGSQLERGNPILVLRNWLQNAATRRSRRISMADMYLHLHLLIRAWNHWCRWNGWAPGKPAASIVYTEDRVTISPPFQVPADEGVGVAASG